MIKYRVPSVGHDSLDVEGLPRREAALAFSGGHVP
jgi:hypothetical protein